MADDRLTTLVGNTETFIELAREMLRALSVMDAKLDLIVEAATAEPPASDLAERLAQLTTVIERQTEAVQAIDARLADLPERAARAVLRGAA